MRPLLTARLIRKLLLSASSQCFHLEFAIDALQSFSFEPGQFVSCVASDPAAGKAQTRAYSIASAPRANAFELCVNRVEGGRFSNMLCDLNEGETITVDGPHGFFTLPEPLADTILIATGTGIAPMRGFLEWLFPEHGPDRSRGRRFSLIYGTRYEADIYYREYFERLAARHFNFEYVATLSRAEPGWQGERGYVQEHVARLVALRESHEGRGAEPSMPPFADYAYICGLSEMVTANRERLMSLGWHRKQIVVERYD